MPVALQKIHAAHKTMLFKELCTKNVSKEFKVHWTNILKAGKSNLACSQQFVPGSSVCKSQSCILNLEDKGLHCCSLITYRFAKHWQTSLWCSEYKVKALSTLLSIFERSLCQGHTMYRSNFPAVADVCTDCTRVLLWVHICCL